MNRTRVVFFIILATCLAILIFSLAGQAVYSRLLLQLYVGSTIFAGGVVALDFLGVLGEHGHVAGHDVDVLADTGVGHALAGHDLAGHDLAGHDVGGHAVPGNGHGGIEPGAAHGHADAGTHGEGSDVPQHGDAESAAAHHPAPPQQSVAPILSALVYLRLLVYFCLGFGPAGWAALVTGRSPLVSLAIAVPVGVLSLVLARAFFRFQRQDTGDVRPETELVGERATVLVPLDHETMGKVRVQAGMSVTDVYARAADPGQNFQRGDAVRIVRVGADGVQVR